jgi:hypothetical protein
MKIEMLAEINEVKLTNMGRATINYTDNGGGILKCIGWGGGYADISKKDASQFRLGDKVKVTIEVISAEA